MAARREQGVWVNASDERATIVVNADGTAISAGGGGGTSMVDDAAFTAGVSSLTPSGGIVTADSVDSGDVGAFAMLANRQQKITLYDSSGVEITSFGGGTQYTEDAAAAANPVGGAIIVVRDDARGGSLTTTDGDNVALRGTNAGELYVKHVDAIPVTDNAGSLTVDGSVTANAGTNLNTSALALEAGGNLAGAATSLAIMDDWDEVDRAKVNPIAGQAGVQGASGVVTALTQRVVLATDVALPAGTNAIGKLSSNSGVDIGDVDVTSVVPGTGATNLGKAIDTALGATDTGVLALTVRDDALATLTEADGDVSALRVDSTGRLWANVSNTVTVASHAVTNAGTFVVQENGAALTSLQLIDDPVIADDAAFTPATSKVMMAGFEFDDSGTDSVDEGDAGAARMSANRNQYIQIRDAAGNERGANVNASNQLSVIDANSASALTSLQLIDDAVFSDDAAFTPGTSKGFAVGFQADESSTDSVDEGDFGVPRITLTRKVITTPQPHTSGGLSIFRSLDIDETEEDVKTSAGQLYSIAAFNRTAAPLYLKFYNATAANVTVGSTTPVLTFVVPANADSDGAGFILEKTYGWTFDTAISVACTTGVADSDTGAPGANDCVLDVGYL